MSLGVNAGFSLGRHVTLQAGYAFQDIDVHKEDRSDVVRPCFGGPVFSVQFRD